MNLLLILAAVAAVVLGLLVYYLIEKPAQKSSGRIEKASRAPDPTRRTPQQPTQATSRAAAEVEKSRNGVMLMPGPDCCWAVRQLVDIWYPDGEVPELPLDACDRIANCKCHYRHMPDRRCKVRRISTDRRNDIRFEVKEDRRSGLDRRKGEDSWKISL